jgi:hypothetical protein
MQSDGGRCGLMRHFILYRNGLPSGNAGNPGVGVFPAIIDVSRKRSEDQNPTHNEGSKGLQQTRDSYHVPSLAHHLKDRAAGNKGTEGWLCSRGSGTRGAGPGKRGTGTR